MDVEPRRLGRLHKGFEVKQGKLTTSLLNRKSSKRRKILKKGAPGTAKPVVEENFSLKPKKSAEEAAKEKAESKLTDASVNE